ERARPLEPRAAPPFLDERHEERLGFEHPAPQARERLEGNARLEAQEEVLERARSRRRRLEAEGLEDAPRGVGEHAHLMRESVAAMPFWPAGENHEATKAARPLARTARDPSCAGPLRSRLIAP